jgi:hypothetical protein
VEDSSPDTPQQPSECDSPEIAQLKSEFSVALEERTQELIDTQQAHISQREQKH